MTKIQVVFLFTKLENLNQEIKEIAKNIKADDNPVLMVVKFKE